VCALGNYRCCGEPCFAGAAISWDGNNLRVYQYNYSCINLWDQDLSTGDNRKLYNKNCHNVLWRARCRSTVNSGNACWKPLLGKQHVTCFLCGLTPACYATMGRLRFLRGPFRGNNSECNSGCFLCGLFTGYIAGQLRGQLVSNGKGRYESQLAAKQRVHQVTWTVPVTG
jgi:hypothetical protein